MLLSVPFMVPSTPIGAAVRLLSGWFGGADFSYYISFAIAALLYLIYRGSSREYYSCPLVLQRSFDARIGCGQLDRFSGKEEVLGYDSLVPIIESLPFGSGWS